MAKTQYQAGIMEKINIICVDDEPEILDICKELLTSEGYAVRCALNGHRAIALFNQEHADVVITDIRMPGMSGLEVLQAIKKIDALAEVIILTGHATVNTAVSALKNEGAFDFLTKPLEELTDLLITIEKALAHRSLRVENALLMEELSQNQIHLANRNKQLRRTKKALELSHQRYLDLYDHAPVGYMALSADGVILEANQTAATLFNMPTDALCHKKFNEFILPGHVNEFDSFCANMGHSSSSACELSLNRVDGTSFVAHIEGMTKLDDTSHTRQFRITVSDVTCQRETAIALLESEQRYRTLVETIPHGIQEIDTHGTITFANAGHAALHGYTANELVGKSVADLSQNKAQGRRLLRQLNDLVNSQPSPKTWIGRDRTRDNQVKDVQVDWNYKRGPDGDVVGFVSVLSDITERKKAETALRESEVRYRSFVEHFTGIAFRLNPNGVPVFYHGAVHPISGYREDELVASNPGWEELIHPEELSLVRMRRKRICLPGEHSITQEYRIRHKDGRWRWVREHIQSTCHPDGQSVTIQGVLFEISDYKQLQKKYYESRKIEAIATLAGGIAHQFNNALAGLMGNIELLEMDAQKEKTNIKKYTQAMMMMIQKMSHLTGQLLAYARGGKYMPTEVHLNDLIKQSLNLMHHRMNPTLEVEIALNVENDWVSADTAQLQMVLLAVMDNAMEAVSQKGRITIQTHIFKPTTDLTHTHHNQVPGNYVCLSISDNGCGMDEQTRHKIFEPFFTTKFVGRGLGLSAAYGIVANHDGWMEVDSTPGKGTVISIYLPTVFKKTPQVTIENKWQPVHGDATILVVEDEAAVMKSMHRLLEKLHYRVIEAATGKTALEMMQTYNGQIDAILLDIRLPDISADELYARMLKIQPDIRVLVCSGYDKDGPAEALLDAGALGFLQKPFSIKTLAAKLRKVLQMDEHSQEAINVPASDQVEPKTQGHLKLV